MHPILVFALACNRGTQPPAEEAAEPPVLSIASPGRGVFAGDVDEMSLEVLVGGPITEIWVNGAPAVVDPAGRLEMDLVSEPGINVVEVIADHDGQQSRDARAWLAGPVREAGTLIEDAVRVQIGPTLLDDDDPDVDDLATVAERLIEDPSTARMIVGKSIDTGYGDVIPSDAAFGEAQVDIAPLDGELLVRLAIKDIEVPFDFDGSGVLFWYNVDGVATSSLAEVTLRLALDDEGKLQLADKSVGLVSFGLTLDWFPDGYEDELAEYIEVTLREEITAALGTTLTELVNGSLTELALDFEAAGSFHTSLALGDIALAEEGIQLTLDAGMTPLSYEPPPAGAGSLMTFEDPPAWPLPEAPLSVAVDDDFLNQALFAVWLGGWLDLDLDQYIPPPFGPSETIGLSVGLPPVATLDNGAVTVDVGEAHIAFPREDGDDLEVALHTGLQVRPVLNEYGELTIEVLTDLGDLDVAAGIVAAPAGEDVSTIPSRLEGALEAILPSLTIAESIPAVPIPGLDIETLWVHPATEGVRLELVKPSIAVGDEGWMLVSTEVGAAP